MLASNIGGTATLIGDPPNIIIGAQVGLSFNSFVVNLAPVIGVILVVHTLAIHVIWGRKLHATPEARARIMAMDERKAISDKALLIKSLIVIAGVLVAFVGARFIGLESGTIGMARRGRSCCCSTTWANPPKSRMKALPMSSTRWSG